MSQDQLSLLTCFLDDADLTELGFDQVDIELLRGNDDWGRAFTRRVERAVLSDPAALRPFRSAVSVG